MIAVGHGLKRHPLITKAREKAQKDGVCFVVEIFAFLGKQDIAVSLKRRRRDRQKRMLAAPLEAAKPKRSQGKVFGFFVDPRIDIFGFLRGDAVVRGQQLLSIFRVGFCCQVVDAFFEVALTGKLIPSRLELLGVAFFDLVRQALGVALEFALFEQPPRQRAKGRGLKPVLEDQAFPKCRCAQIGGYPDGIAGLCRRELKDGVDIVEGNAPRLKVRKVIRFFA